MGFFALAARHLPISCTAFTSILCVTSAACKHGSILSMLDRESSLVNSRSI